MIDDEDDAPQFPWPLWLPAIVWIAHGLTLLLFLIWRFTIYETPTDSIDITLAILAIVVFGLFGIWVMSVGVRLILGRGNSLTFVKTFSLGIAIGTAFIVFYVQDYMFERARLIFGYESLIFFICALIAVFFEKRWRSWRKGA